MSDNESQTNPEAEPETQEDENQEEDVEEPVEAETKIGDDDANITLETALELIEHGKHLLMALYKISKLFKKEDYQQYLTLKGDRKKLAQTITKEKAYIYGRKLRFTYTVLQHARAFQQASLKTLSHLSKNSKDADYDWDYVFAKPLVDLFRYYTKLHIFLQVLPDFLNPVAYYDAAYTKITGKADPSSAQLREWLKVRTSYKLFEAELQNLTVQFMSLFRSIAPSLHQLLSENAFFPWKMINLLDHPQPSLNNEAFFKTKYLCLIHLNDLCESFILYGLVYMQHMSKDPELYQLFQRITNRQIVLNIVADVNVDISKLFGHFKKLKGKQADLSSSPIDNAESNFKQTLDEHIIRQRRIAMHLQQFNNATNVDMSLLCTKYPILFALLGLANYELQCVFRLKEAKPSLTTYENDIISLVHYYELLTTKFLKARADIQRFFLYNIREFDANYLDTLVHSFTISKVQFEQIEQLILALRTVDIAEFDNGKYFDLYPCQALIRSIVTGFNAFATKRGITHISPLMYLISGVSFRLQAYQDLFGLVLDISKIDTYWVHLSLLHDISQDFKQPTFPQSVSIIGLLHYAQFDKLMQSEYPSVNEKLTEEYNALVKYYHNAIYTFLKELQDKAYKEFRQQMTPENILANKPIQAGSESTFAERKSSKLLTRLVTKLTRIMMNSKQLGIVVIGGEEHNIHQEILDKLSNVLRNMFSKSELPPIQFYKELETAKWAYQIFCNASGINFEQKLAENMESMSFFDNKIGPVAKNFKDKYVEIAKKDIFKAIYSSSQRIFVGDQQISQYLSPTPLYYLQKIIGVNGVTRISMSITKIIAEKLKKFIEQLSSLSYSEKDIDSGHFSKADDGTALLKDWQKISVLLQLRLQIQQYTDEQYKLPHYDKALLKAAEDAQVLKLFDDNKFLSVLGACFSLPSWANYSYNVVHDAFNENQHLLGNLLDLLLGAGIASKKETNIDNFYNTFFKKMIGGIGAGSRIFKDNKKVDFPGIKLVVVAESIVRHSVYADYSMIEPIISYSFIKNSNMEKFQEFAQDQQQKELGINTKKDKKKEKKSSDKKAQESITAAEKAALSEAQSIISGDSQSSKDGKKKKEKKKDKEKKKK